MGCSSAGETISAPASGLLYQLSPTPKTIGHFDTSSPPGAGIRAIDRRIGVKPSLSMPARLATSSAQAPAALISSLGSNSPLDVTTCHPPEVLAIDVTLRAARPEDEAPASLPLDPPAASEGPEGSEAIVAGPEPLAGDAVVAPATVDASALLELSDEDFPEPEPPAWAVDPAPAVDVDGDGEPDLTVDP